MCLRSTNIDKISVDYLFIPSKIQVQNYVLIIKYQSKAMGPCFAKVKSGSQISSRNLLGNQQPHTILGQTQIQNMSKYKNFRHFFKYLKSKLENQSYFNQGDSEEKTTAIENTIAKIQSAQWMQYFDKIKRHYSKQFITYTYEKAKFYHFKFDEIKALQTINELLQADSPKRQEIQNAGISILNLRIFQYLLIVSYFIQDANLEDKSLSIFREKFIWLFQEISKQPLQQDQKLQMIVFVSSLYFNYAIAKWNLINQNRNMKKNTIEDQNLNPASIKHQLSALEKIVLNAGLQLNLNSQEPTVKNVSLVRLKAELYKNKKYIRSTKWQVSKLKSKITQQKQLLEVRIYNKLYQIQKQKTRLKKIENKANQSEYFVQQAFFKVLEQQGKTQKLKSHFYFLNLSAIYISRSNSANDKQSFAWVKTYQEQQLYCLGNQTWQAFQANSLTISIRKQNKTALKQEHVNNAELKEYVQEVMKAMKNSRPKPEIELYNCSQPRANNYFMKERKLQESNTPAHQRANSFPNKANPSIQDYRQYQKYVKNNFIPMKVNVQVLQYNKYKDFIQYQYNQSKLKPENIRNQPLLIRSHIPNQPTNQIAVAQKPASNIYTSHPNSNHRGLLNLGNTCYMNSALQCLHKSRHFTQKFSPFAKVIKQKYSRKSRTYQLTDLFQALIGQMWLNKKPFDARQIKEVMGEKNYQFKHFNQSDATEFVLTFLLIISQELNHPTELQEKEIDQYNETSQSIYEKIKFNEETYCKSIVEDTFTGRYKVVYSSTNPRCKHTYTLFEKFNVHYVEIPPESRYPTLQQCLSYTKRTDHLKTEDRMTCDICQATTFDTKNMEIFEVGQILVLSFKRFLNGRKNEAIVKVPEFLEPSKIVSGPQLQSYEGMKYKLYGAIIHYGSLSGGHYIALCYNSKSKMWMQYNDSIVTQISKSFQQIDFSNAMTLFYEIFPPQEQKNVYPSNYTNQNKKTNVELKTPLSQPKQQKQLYSLACSVMQWLVRSSPFQQQLNNRLFMLQRFQIPAKEDLLKLQLMTRNRQIDKSYISDLLLKRQSIFKPGHYDPNRSQLQNFTIAFLQMLGQSFLGSLKKISANQRKQISQDFKSDLLQAEYNKIHYLKCGHKVQQKAFKASQTIQLTGIRHNDQRWISTYFNTSRRFQSQNKVFCEKCKKEKQYQYQYQIIKPNKLLMIELNRFTGKSKNQNIVFIPLQLQIKKIVKDYNDKMYRDKVYRISAVISHRGPAEQGQYFVHCYDFKARRWAHCVNQESVTKNKDMPKLENAYCLIYELVFKN